MLFLIKHPLSLMLSFPQIMVSTLHSVAEVSSWVKLHAIPLFLVTHNQALSIYLLTISQIHPLLSPSVASSLTQTQLPFSASVAASQTPSVSF